VIRITSRTAIMAVGMPNTIKISRFELGLVSSLTSLFSFVQTGVNHELDEEIPFEVAKELATKPMKTFGSFFAFDYRAIPTQFPTKGQ